MRLLFVIMSISMICTKVYGQQMASIDIHMSKASIESILDAVQSKYDYHFSFSPALFKDFENQNLQLEDASIEAFLDQLFDEKSIEYKVIDKHVLIREAEQKNEPKAIRKTRDLSIRGKIFQKNGEKFILVSALVSIKGTSIGTYSDDNGFFEIRIPERHRSGRLVIHYLGFSDQEYAIADLDKEILLVPMTQGACVLSEVTVINTHKKIRVQKIGDGINLSESFFEEGTSSIAGSDLIRQIQLLPGVAAYNDAASEIKIRGSKADETLLILDGMPLYNASHYFGLFSAINTAHIDKVTVYRNAFPLRYGGKTGGMVALESRSEVHDQSSVESELNLLTTNLNLRHKLSNNASFTITGRSTLRNVSNSQFNIADISNRNEDVDVNAFSDDIKNNRTTPQFKFRDLNAKLIFKPTEKQTIDINYFGSSDLLENMFEQRIKNNKQDRLKYNRSEMQSWKNSAASINYLNKYSPDIEFRATTFMTRYDNDRTEEIQLIKMPGDNESIPASNQIGYSHDNGVRDVGANIEAIFQKGNYKWTAGVAGTSHDVAYVFRDNKRDRLSGSGTSQEISIYAGSESTVLDRINISAGLRMTRFTLTNQIYSSPRIYSSISIHKDLSLKGSYGQYQQFIRELQYEYRGDLMSLWVTAGDQDVEVLQSNNYMVGATLRKPWFILDVELYHKSMDGVLEYAVINPATGSNSLNTPQEYGFYTGKGLSRGIDVILSTGYQNYDTYISYCLSKVTESYEKLIRGQYFPSEDDRRHQFKWINSYRLRSFVFGVDAVYVSGRPYTDLRNLSSNADIRDLDSDNRLQYLSSYQRFDASIGYTFSYARGKFSLFASVFNLTNNQNVNYVQSISTEINNNSNQNVQNTIVGNENNLLNRTYNLSLKMTFK